LREIEDDDEFVSLAPDSGEIIGLSASSNRGRRLDLSLVDIGNFKNAICHKTDLRSTR
jgi:hypothetical protein